MFERIGRTMANHGNPLSEELFRALSSVNRRDFLPEGWRGNVRRRAGRSNTVVGLEIGSTMSQPLIVAEMINFLDIPSALSAKTGQIDILEIGAASGYNAAVMASIDPTRIHVDTTELDESFGGINMFAHATEKLTNYQNVEVHPVTRFKPLGLPNKTFDFIIVTGAVSEMPPSLIAQLKTGGKMIAPVTIKGKQPGNERLTIFEKLSDSTVTILEIAANVGFVPIISSHPGGWIPGSNGLNPARPLP
jgi:protein-L-isoaspartate(D-aspartate) O-methyltransferase